MHDVEFERGGQRLGLRDAGVTERRRVRGENAGNLRRVGEGDVIGEIAAGRVAAQDDPPRIDVEVRLDVGDGVEDLLRVGARVPATALAAVDGDGDVRGAAGRRDNVTSKRRGSCVGRMSLLVHHLMGKRRSYSSSRLASQPTRSAEARSFSRARF
jgi:hypothetical protein